MMRLPPSSTRLIFALPSIPQGSDAATGSTFEGVVASAAWPGPAEPIAAASPAPLAAASDLFTKSRRVIPFESDIGASPCKWGGGNFEFSRQ